VIKLRELKWVGHVAGMGAEEMHTFFDRKILRQENTWKTYASMGR
jgi:hypothetical protein